MFFLPAREANEYLKLAVLAVVERGRVDRTYRAYVLLEWKILGLFLVRVQVVLEFAGRFF